MDMNALLLEPLEGREDFRVGMLGTAGGAETCHDVFERAAVGIFQTTPDGRFLQVNAKLAAILGYESPKALTGAIRDIAHEFYVDPTRRAEFRSMVETNGAVMNFESRIYRQGGEIAWIAENAWIVRDAAGTIVHYEGIVEDITCRKQSEAWTLQAKAADVANRAQQEFMARFSREIRGPLDGLVDMLHRLAETELTTQQKQYAEAASASAESLLSLINNMLDFSATTRK
jgi:Amt family ammonium transporter